MKRLISKEMLEEKEKEILNFKKNLSILPELRLKIEEYTKMLGIYNADRARYYPNKYTPKAWSDTRLFFITPSVNKDDKESCFHMGKEALRQ